MQYTDRAYTRTPVGLLRGKLLNWGYLLHRNLKAGFTHGAKIFYTRDVADAWLRKRPLTGGGTVVMLATRVFTLEKTPPSAVSNK